MVPIINVKVPYNGGSVSYQITPPTAEPLATQEREPVRIDSFWLYHGYWVLWQDVSITYRPEEIVTLIKREVLRHERQLARARQEIETLERVATLPITNREVIPDDVRMFVWQRDEGKCVRCGSREKLEFDHIIPVADGGSSTERNIQLLCEPCNRSKGRSL
jgi:hypothetical protein